MEEFLNKIEGGDVNSEVLGTFTEEEWSTYFPAYLVYVCHIASHEVNQGIFTCLCNSIKMKMLDGNNNIREEVNSLSNKYFFEAITMMDDDIELILDEKNMTINVKPRDSFIQKYPQLQHQ